MFKLGSEKNAKNRLDLRFISASIVSAKRKEKIGETISRRSAVPRKRNSNEIPTKPKTKVVDFKLKLKCLFK